METKIDATRLPEDGSPFWIHHPLDIRQQFRQLCKRGERLKLWYGPGASMVSVVLEVRSNGDIVLDVGPDSRINQIVLAAPRVVAEANLAGVDLKCELGPLIEVTHHSLAAFAAPQPQRLHRLQRREFHRVGVPVGLAVRCTIPEHPSHLAPAPAAPGRQAVNLLDISLGGLAFEEPAGSSLMLSAKTLLNHCRLQLDDMGVIHADLEVRYLSDIRSRSGTERHKVGCSFQRLSSGGEQLFQRFINRIELDQKTPGSV